MYRVEKSWIPNPGNPITVAAIGDRDKLNILVLEGLEERVLSIDCKRHIYHREPFTQSISTLPQADKEEMERVMTSGVLKKAINFILEALSDINERDVAEREASRRNMKKQVDLKSTENGGGRKAHKK